MRLFRRRRKNPPAPRVAPSGRIILQFKSGEELDDGTEVGKIFIYDDEGDPDDLLEEVKWMTQADAQKYAKERGYEYEEIYAARRLSIAVEQLLPHAGAFCLALSLSLLGLAPIDMPRPPFQALALYGFPTLSA